jgi:hypothetical protein
MVSLVTLQIKKDEHLFSIQSLYVYDIQHFDETKTKNVTDQYLPKNDLPANLFNCIK